MGNSRNKTFGVGHGYLSHTNETVWKTAKWLGDPSNKCVTIIDTPGKIIDRTSDNIRDF